MRRNPIPIQHTVQTPYMVGPVHFYLFEQDDVYLLIDTGPPTEVGRAYLREHVDLRRLTHVLVTHCHIDHYGQACWLADNSDAAVYLPRVDILKHERHSERMREVFAMIENLGFDQTNVALLRDRLSSSMMPSFPANCDAAENLPAGLGIEVLSCPGHSQSDLVYVGQDWAATGDTLLRGVFQSPLLDVDLERGGRFENYRAYCGSIVKLAGLESKRILPGHRGFVEGVRQTLLFYVSKMLQRLQRLAPYLAGNTVAEVISKVFPEMADPFHVYIKASEIVFMKDLLDQPELLVSALRRIDLYEPVAGFFEGLLDRGVHLKN